MNFPYINFRLNEDSKVLSPDELLYRCVEAVNFTHNPKHAQMDIKLRWSICYIIAVSIGVDPTFKVIFTPLDFIPIVPLFPTTSLIFVCSLQKHSTFFVQDFSKP